MPESLPAVAIVISNVTRPVIFEFIAKSRLASRFKLHFVLLNPSGSPFEENLRDLGAAVHYFPLHGLKSVPFLTWRLFRLFRRIRPHAVHTHLLEANLAGLMAAFLARVPVRVHTRHHSDPYHYRYRHVRFYDWWICLLSTKIVAACLNVVEVLRDMEGVPERKIAVIPFGLNREYYGEIPEAAVKNLARKYGVEGRFPVVCMVSRYLEIKGLQYAVPAFRSLREKYPGACLMIANAGVGNYRQEVKGMLSGLPQESYREIPFELDIPAFYAVADVFVHVPVDRRSEAFGQSYTESLAAGAPCVFTLSGVAPEFVVDGRNALVVPFRDSGAVYQAVLRLVEDRQLAEKLGMQGRADVLERFSFERYLEGHAAVWKAET